MDDFLENRLARVRTSGQGFPLPIELRPLWRIALIVLSVNSLKDKSGYAPINKIKIATWMLNRKNLWSFYVESLEDKASFVIALDDSDEKAINICMVKELIFLRDDKLGLTDLGVALTSTICSENIFPDEREFLTEISKKLTNAAVSKILGD